MKKHSPKFEALCEETRSRIKEIDNQTVHDALQHKPDFVLIDIREDHERAQDFIPGSKHLGKGIIERDIENLVPDFNQKIVLYCGGGYRSALAAEALQKMGYTSVLSLAGGMRGWREQNFPVTKESL